MRLSIITINKNNVHDLSKTLESVASQTCKDFEHVIIDGESTDNSVDVIKNYESSLSTLKTPHSIKWISEPDKGIYNAMNKGIRMASGGYVQFLNSGDCLADATVVERMLGSLEENNFPSILYGNMLKVFKDGKILNDKCFAGQDISFLGFYTGTLNHSSALIKRSLFEKYGFYDESLRIVSDWKWYLQAIALGEEMPVYADINVTLFDMNGISETNKNLDKIERRKVLEELIPAAILKDYDDFAFPIDQIKRLKRHPWAYKVVWFIERCLFKVEKAEIKRGGITQYR
ncbi:MAG: glycosyltransferase [bacterium]|nr:glycosyltransferase [Candidatus Limimorpha caballi]